MADDCGCSAHTAYRDGRQLGRYDVLRLGRLGRSGRLRRRGRVRPGHGQLDPAAALAAGWRDRRPGDLDRRRGPRLGRSSFPSTEEQRSDGAAYNPFTRAWRPIPAAPLPAFYEYGAVWTGTELVVLAGTYDDSDRGPLGAAYDPARDQWRVIADSPLGQGYALDLGWDGTEVLAAYPVPESPDDVADDGATDRTTAAAYDLTTDSWRKLPRPSVQPNWSVPVWTPEVGVYWDATPDPGTAYLIDDETWVALPAVDGPHREFPSLVWTGTEVIAWGGNDNCEAYADGGAADCELEPLNDGFAMRLG